MKIIDDIILQKFNQQDQDGHHSVNYPEMVPLVIRSIQELDELADSAENEE